MSGIPLKMIRFTFRRCIQPAQYLTTLLCVIAPLPALAEVCDKERPNWDGLPVSGLHEAMTLFSSPAGLVLLAASALALRFRNQWGALIVVLLWTGLISVVTMVDPNGINTAARAEGCVGSATLFIVAVAAICVGMILYTAPRTSRP